MRAKVPLLAMAASLAASSAWAQSSQPASRSAPAGPGVLQGQVTLIAEIDEHHLKVQESWQIRNPTGGTVAPESVVFDLGSDVRRIRIDENVVGFAHVEGETVIRATRGLGSGTHAFAVSYLLDLDGDTARFARSFPIPVTGGRLIVEDLDGVRASGSTSLSVRNRDLNGLSFRIFDFAVPGGTPFDVVLRGLPSRAAWPRAVAVALSAMAFIWMVISVLRPGGDARLVKGALSAEARREQILKALELLEEDQREGRIEGRKYEKRRRALMDELARVLRELDLSGDPRGHPA